MKLEEIKKLAELARIEMTEEEMLDMAGDFDSIISYIDQIREADIFDSGSRNNVLTNVIREDKNTNQPGEYSEKILDEMPETQDGYLKVKQIL